MKTSSQQVELPLRLSSVGDTVPINARCSLKREGSLRMVSVAGLPMHQWVAGDRLGESYAIVNLIQCGYAQQTEVARAFGSTTRTVRRLQRRHELAGASGLGRSSGRPAGTQGAPGDWVCTAQVLHRAGTGIRAIAQRLRVSVSTVSKWLKRGERSAVSAVDELPEQTLVVLRDFHAFLEDGNPVLIRTLRDVLTQAKTTSVCVVLLGCRQVIPAELQRELTLVDFALPGKEILGGVLDSICGSAGIVPPVDDERDAVLETATGLTTIEAENAMALSVVETRSVSPGGPACPDPLNN